MENLLVMLFILFHFSVGAGLNTLMIFSDGLGRYIFRQKVEQARPVRKEMEGKFAAVARETQGEHTRYSQSRNMSVTRINGDYIVQVSGEIVGGISRKLSQDFSRTKFPLLDALSKLDEILLNPQIRTHSGIFPGTSHNTYVEN